MHATFLLIGLILMGCQSNWPQAVPRKVTLDHVAQVAMEMPSYLPIVPVMINGRGPFRFLLDTGCATVAVPPELAQRLALPPGAVTGSTFVQSANGAVTSVQYVRIDALKVGDAVFEQLDAKVLKLPSAYRDSDLAIDGLLGLRVFHDMLLTVDYPARRLILDPAGELNPADPQVIRFQLQDGQHLLLPAAIGDQPLRLMLDTGTSMGLLLLPGDAAQQRWAHGPISAGNSASATGGMKLTVGRLRDPLRIGSIQLSNIIAYALTDSVMVLSSSELEPLFGQPGSLLGGQLLSQFTVAIDQRNGLVRLLEAVPGAAPRQR
ncbi:MAG: aspartyl protease family protein [Phycisphaeraceae bacterium]|nr:aspartyl protease family protein [Phycisphaeraceae bacterium]